MRTVYLSLGSNLGDRMEYLRRGVAGLHAMPGVRVVRLSERLRNGTGGRRGSASVPQPGGGRIDPTRPSCAAGRVPDSGKRQRPRPDGSLGRPHVGYRFAALRRSGTGYPGACDSPSPHARTGVCADAPDRSSARHRSWASRRASGSSKSEAEKGKASNGRRRRKTGWPTRPGAGIRERGPGRAW